MDQIILTSKSHLPSTSLVPFTVPTFQRSSSPSEIKFTQIQFREHHHQAHNFPDLPNFEQTQQIHAHMIKTQFDHTQQIPLSPLQSHLSSAAQYNFLITSYINNNFPEYSLKIYASMRRMDTQVDNFTVPSVLKACGQCSMISLGKEIQGFVLKNGLDSDVFVRNALIQMYSQCGSMVLARLVFDQMFDRDAVSWSTMIRCYVRNRILEEAFELINDMNFERVRPNGMALLSMVNLYADIGDAKMRESMHSYVLRHSNDEKLGVPITTALIDMYAKIGNLAYARRLFDGLAQKTIVTWTVMISGYIRCNKLEEGVRLFNQMREESVFPNEISVLSLIIECGFVGVLELGKCLHSFILRNGFVISLSLATALVDMYGKCGDLRSARAIFDIRDEKDVMFWSAMISAYAQANCTSKACDLFVQMREKGLKPNEVTMVSLFSLCADVGALDLGKWIHSYINQQQIGIDVILKTALINMYAKCGDIDTARKLFVEATDRDICMWNAMMSGFALHGWGTEALELLEEMERLRIEPNNITFISVLHACSHAGLVAEGKMLFEKMIHVFGLIPKIEHYGCMVDLLGRAGQLDEAHKLIKSMPMQPNTLVWGALLAACKLHKNPDLGEMATKKLLKLEPQNCGYSILMSNIYASVNRWDDVAGLRRAMKDGGMRKQPGLSSIEVNGSIHDFVMGDKAHPHRRKIYEMAEEMSMKLKEAGYTPNKSVIVRNIEDEDKEKALNYHSEKLAMAFGLISTNVGSPIRIVKNLRVCDDCHSATKLLSKIYGRVIIVRDRNRFHHFKDGSCSCGDYW